MSLLLAAYITVLLAELVGDKTLYTVGSLATRHRLVPIVVGATAATALKMGAAVLFGGFVRALPAWMISIVSSVSFLALGLFLLLKRPRSATVAAASPASVVALASFGSMFLTEWADVGQIAAAVLAAESGKPFVIWVASSAAMLTKILLAVTLGLGVRRWVPMRLARAAGVAVCMSMAVLALLRVDT